MKPKYGVSYGHECPHEDLRKMFNCFYKVLHPLSVQTTHAQLNVTPVFREIASRDAYRKLEREYSCIYLSIKWGQCSLSLSIDSLSGHTKNRIEHDCSLNECSVTHQVVGRHDDFHLLHPTLRVRLQNGVVHVVFPDQVGTFLGGLIRTTKTRAHCGEEGASIISC